MAYLVACHTLWRDARVPTTLLLPYHLPIFAVGMAVAAVSVRRELPGAPGLPEALAASPVTWVALTASLYWLTTTGATGPRVTLDPTTVWPAATLQLLYCLLGAVLLVVARWSPLGGPVDRFLSSGPLRLLARWSYGLFLWHVLALTLIAEVVDHEVFTGAFWALFLPSLILSAIAAEASLRWIERPTARWRGAVSRSRERGGAGAVAVPAAHHPSATSARRPAEPPRARPR